MKTRSIRRGTAKGSAVYAAAYRSGSTLVDERTGALYKHAWRRDVPHTEIVLPVELKDDPALDWARERHTLWNAAERAETRINSRVAREYKITFPKSFTLKERVGLARAFAQSLADRYGNAVDIGIHNAREGRAPNNHAHLLATTREVTPGGFARKTQAELMGQVLRERGFNGNGRDEFAEVRAVWDQHYNRALELKRLSRMLQALDKPESEYRRELLARGFDINAQQRADYANTRLTEEERLRVQARQLDIAARETSAIRTARETAAERARLRAVLWYRTRQLNAAEPEDAASRWRAYKAGQGQTAPPADKRPLILSASREREHTHRAEEIRQRWRENRERFLSPREPAPDHRPRGHALELE